MYPAFLKELKNAARESWTAWKHSRQWRQVALKAAELTGFLDQYSSIGGTVFPVVRLTPCYGTCCDICTLTVLQLATAIGCV